MFSIHDLPRTGLVYRLHIGDHHYTGSTVDTIHNRIISHKTSFKGSGECPERKVYKFIADNGGWDAVKVSVLETDIPEAKLREKENSYISKDDPYSLNSYCVIAPLIPARVVKRSEPRKAYDRAYYEVHKEELKKRRMERYAKDKADPERYARILETQRAAQTRWKRKATPDDTNDTKTANFP